MALSNYNLDRFWKNIDKQSDDKCWNWIGKLSKGGYGNFWIKDLSDKAHRISWFINYGELPPKIFVCHHCDNRKCVNPKHLFLGTSSDNNKDRAKKGRSAKPIWCIPKLNNEQKEELIKRYLNGESQRKLAKFYNINQRLVWQIIHKKIPERNYKHAPKLTDEQRTNLLNDWNNGIRKYVLAMKYNIAISSVRYIIHKEEILNQRKLRRKVNAT